MEEGEEVWLHLMRVGWNAASLPYFECLVLQLRNAKMNNWDYVEFTYKWFGWFKDIRTDNDSDLSMNVWVTVDTNAGMGYKCCLDSLKSEYE